MVVWKIYNLKTSPAQLINILWWWQLQLVQKTAAFCEYLDHLGPKISTLAFYESRIQLVSNTTNGLRPKTVYSRPFSSTWNLQTLQVIAG